MSISLPSASTAFTYFRVKTLYATGVNKKDAKSMWRDVYKTEIRARWDRLPMKTSKLPDTCIGYLEETFELLLVLMSLLSSSFTVCFIDSHSAVTAGNLKWLLPCKLLRPERGRERKLCLKDCQLFPADVVVNCCQTSVES